MRDFLSEFGAIIVGVTLGAMAHFGRLISEMQFPPIHLIIGFVMQLGLIALVAAVIAEKMQIESSLMQSLTASVLTIAANEIVNWLKGRAQGVVAKLSPGSGLDIRMD